MASEMHESSEVDWTELDHDLLCLIAKKLEELPYFMKAREVCKSWRSSIDATKPPKQLPWLLMTRTQQEETNFHQKQDETKLIYSLFSREIHALKFPSPSSIYDFSHDLMASKWKLTAKHGVRLFHFYAASREMKIVDELSGSTITIIPRNKIFIDWLITTPDGTVLGIVNPFSMKSWLPIERACFEVHKLQNENNDPYWAKVSGIGDLMIFLNSDSCFCLSASDFDGFEGNCIYFSNNTDCHKRSGLCEIGRFDLGENRTELLARNNYVGHFWIVPR